MFKKIFIPVFGILGIGSFYLHEQKVDISNQYLKSILKLLQSQNSELPIFLMKRLIQFKMIKKSDLLQKYVLSYGFDFDGNYLQQLIELGFSSVQIGPVSLMPSEVQQKRRHCGSKIALANINTYYENWQNNNTKTSNIGVCIQPNYQILKYTPYLISENIIQCMRQFESLNQIFNKQVIKYFILKINNPQIISLNTIEYLNMISHLIIDTHKIIQKKDNLIKQTNQHNNQLLIQNQTLIYLQIPSQNQNPELFKIIKALPQTTNLIIDGSQLEIIRNKSKSNLSNLVLGRTRLSFQNLIQRIINGTI